MRPLFETMPLPRRIHIEAEMDRFVQAIGGERVTDLVGTPSPPFQNADYVFRSDNIVAELKCLTEDKSADKAHLRKISDLFEHHMKKGGTPYLAGVRLIQSNKCSPAFQHDLWQILARPIRRHLDKEMPRFGTPKEVWVYQRPTAYSCSQTMET